MRRYFNISLILAPSVIGLYSVYSTTFGASLESLWGPDASTSRKKSGRAVGALDRYSDSYRAWESTGPYAERQGAYREELKNEPVCYDPRNPERMPWYVEKEYETRTTVTVDTTLSAGAHVHYGSAITFYTDFTNRSQWYVNFSCGAGLHWEAPSVALDYATVCAAGTTLNVSIAWSGIWNPSNNPDFTYYQSVPQMPSCANGLRGLFSIVDDGTNCGNSRRGLGHHWGVRFRGTKQEIVDITPTYTECFYP